MKTLEQILTYKHQALDGRDLSRLAQFIPLADWPKLGLEPREGVDMSKFVVKPLTEVNVKIQLVSDLAFAFEKALNKRGISAGLMRDVIKMWLWVLDDPLADDSDDDYAQYGLPLLKKVAEKYELPNLIGEKYGNEAEFASE